MRTGPDRFSSLRRADRRGARLRLTLLGLALLALFSVFLSLRSTTIGFVTPAVTLKNLATAASLGAAELLKQPLYDKRLSIINASPHYLETMTRLRSALLLIALGACLSAAGAAVQGAFSNPIATPAMLGISSGIGFANIYLVLRYSSLAASMTGERFLYGYAFALALLGLVLLIGRLMGRQRSSVTDMLLAGAVVTRLVGQVGSAIQAYWMDETQYLALQEMNLYGTGIGTVRGAAFLAAALALGLAPLWLTRFSYNAVSFDDESARGFGISAPLLRVIGLVCSVVLVTAALIHCGDVALLALLAPHLARCMFGADFRSLLPGCILMGALTMLCCGAITAFFAFDPLLSVISIGSIVNLVATPLLIVMLVRGRRGWE
ncbi:MAG: iron ABC transporter permease [Candidatus Accumulibacter sp.]|jgi:iron complex transport system permease protein|nr:iron ABC transporter permease [Accumulibacter sp.]